MRHEDHGTNQFTPSPAAYGILGDFDFKDPTLPKEHILNYRGKSPKFAFGSRPVIKNMNYDFPGPAEYETD